MLIEDGCRCVTTHTSAAVLLENEKLIQPEVITCDSNTLVHQREPSEASSHTKDVRPGFLALPEAIQLVPVLAVDVQVLIPDV
jgi:hypothetical protein